MDQGALTGAGAAQNGEGAACRDGEGYVPQHRLPLIAEAHMVEFNVAGGGLLGFRDVLLLLGLENVAHPVQGDPCLAHIRQHTAQGTYRPGQGLVVCNEGQKSAQGHVAMDSFHCAHQDDHHDLQAG